MRFISILRKVDEPPWDARPPYTKYLLHTNTYLYLNLALKNLLKEKIRTLLTTLSITIGITSLTLLLGISAALKNTLFQNLTQTSPLTQITVQSGNNNSFFKLLTNKNKNNKITPASLEQFKKLPHVISVTPEMNYSNISSLQINIFGQTLQTDSMIFGLPLNFIKNDLPEEASIQSWQNPKEPYPAIIPRKIIDLYNLTIAESNDLPKFSEKNLIGTELTLLPDYSTFFNQGQSGGAGDAGDAGGAGGTGGEASPKNIKIKVAGFSDKVNLVGITLPLEIVKNLNQTHDPSYQENYLRAFVNVDQPENAALVKDQIKILGFEANSSLKDLEILEQNLKIITVGLSLISLIILLIAGLTIAITFTSSVNERKKEIGIFRAIGATKMQIQKIFLIEAALIGLTGGLSGIILAILSSIYLNQYGLGKLPDLTSKPQTIFIFEPITLLLILIFAVALSLIFAFIPTTKAARLKPVDALMN